MEILFVNSQEVKIDLKKLPQKQRDPSMHKSSNLKNKWRCIHIKIFDLSSTREINSPLYYVNCYIISSLVDCMSGVNVVPSYARLSYKSKQYRTTA
jgi:hypothetical protein